MAAACVERATGKRENVLAEYFRLVERAREERRRKNAELLWEKPELAHLIDDPDTQKIFMLEAEGDRQTVLIASLPKKKGSVDDLFIFKKLPG